MLQGQCHCGNIQLLAKNLPDSLTACNCSICKRIGALWAYYPLGQVKFSIQKTTPQSYAWGKREIDFFHCSSCGCTTHYQSVKDGARQIIAVNARMAPITSIENIPIRYFDGAKSWQAITDVDWHLI